MARRFVYLRTESISANVRQEADIKLLQDFKARCAEGGNSVQSVLLYLVRDWLHPHQGGL